RLVRPRRREPSWPRTAGSGDRLSSGCLPEEPPRCRPASRRGRQRDLSRILVQESHQRVESTTCLEPAPVTVKKADKCAPAAHRLGAARDGHRGPAPAVDRRCAPGSNCAHPRPEQRGAGPRGPGRVPFAFGNRPRGTTEETTMSAQRSLGSRPVVGRCVGPSLMLLCTLVLTAPASSQPRSPDPGTPDHIRAATHSVDDAAIIENARESRNWPSYGLDYAETRFSRLRQIDTSNVKRLGLVWAYDLASTRGVEATPLVVDGIMYVSASWSIVHAIDARTGKRLWTYDPKVSREAGYRGCCDVVNRGVALYRGKVYVGAYD